MKKNLTWPRLWLAAWYLPALVVSAASALDFIPNLSTHDLPQSLHTPSLMHPMGFDAFGRDLLLITWKASVASSLLSLAALITTLALAVIAGTLLAVAPERPRFFGLRALEGLLALPALLLALAWAAIRGPGWDTLIFSLLLGALPSLTRLVHARATELIAEEYVLAARSLGATPSWIARTHLLPGVLELCRVKLPNLLASIVLAEATLSYLGIGVPIGQDSWGALLAQGKDYLIEAPHLAIATGIPLVLTALSLQLLGSRNHS